MLSRIETLLPKIQQHINLILSVIIIVLFVWPIATSLVNFIDTTDLLKQTGINNPHLTDQNQTNSTQTSQINLLTLSGLNLFGEASETAKITPIVEAVIDIPATTLNLTLKGSFTHSNHTLASASIEDSSRVGQLYHIGDEILSNVTLEKVYRTHVVIRRNGELEALNFPELKGSKRSGSSISSASKTNRFSNNPFKRINKNLDAPPTSPPSMKRSKPSRFPKKRR